MGKVHSSFHRKERGILITRIMARDGQDCALCKEPLDRSIRDEGSEEYITFDHIIPVSAGGDDLLKNLQLAHARCNHLRGAAEIEVR